MKSLPHASVVSNVRKESAFSSRQSCDNFLVSDACKIKFTKNFLNFLLKSTYVFRFQSERYTSLFLRTPSREVGGGGSKGQQFFCNKRKRSRIVLAESTFNTVLSESLHLFTFNLLHFSDRK